MAELDPAIDNVADLRNALKLANCKAIFFDPVTETQDNLLLLRKAIPEFYECKTHQFYRHSFSHIHHILSVSDVDDDSHGQFFHSKYYPTLKYFVQTGFDNELGTLTICNDRRLFYFFFFCRMPYL